MPTEYAVVSVAEPERRVHLLPTGAEAAMFAARLNDEERERNSGGRFRVIPIVTEDANEPSWQQREQAKFESGEYTAVPWADEPWVRREHYSHVSRLYPRQLSYTYDDAHGAADRQTRILPGRYLEQYHSRVLSMNDIRTWVARWIIVHEGLAVRFATTEREIEYVYRNGPNSCMAQSTRSYRSDIHPTRVYAAGDLAVAYLQRDGEERISARCLCWPERRIYGRIYDGNNNQLQSLLAAEGYRPGNSEEDWEGARLLLHRVYDQNRIVMPYFDSPNVNVDVDLEADVVRIAARGSVFARSTEGVTHFGFPANYVARTPAETILAPNFNHENRVALQSLTIAYISPRNPHRLGTPTADLWNLYVGAEGMTLLDFWLTRPSHASHLWNPARVNRASDLNHRILQGHIRLTRGDTP